MSSASPSSIIPPHHQPQNLDEPHTPEIRTPVPDRPGSATGSYSRSNSACSLTYQHSFPSSSSSSGCSLSRLLPLQEELCHTQTGMWLLGLIGNCVPDLAGKAGKRKGAVGRRGKMVGKIGLLLGLLFLVNLVMLLRIQHHRLVGFRRHSYHKSPRSESGSSVPVVKSCGETTIMLQLGKKPRKGTFDRLLALSAHALAENKREPKDLWHEPYIAATSWKPCADLRTWEPNGGHNGYIMVTANGGMNQQRVAVCNAVVVARLLNSTLVIPKFMYSSVWRDVSQFSDIYQEDYFMNYLSGDIPIVKELPEDLKSLDLDAIGSVVTDVDIGKESKPSFYLKHILPILLKNRVIHFVGFGNRLAFDPMPFQLQRLRCRCNFHALQFVPKIQQTAALLLQRVRKDAAPAGPLDHHLIGSYSEPMVKGEKGHPTKNSRYLALHLRFEIDMVAHSLCEYGGGDEERRELEAYRKIHFPALAVLTKTKNLPSPAALRAEGLCPLSPEEAVLMLAALGFTRKTRIFVAGADIYGGTSRLTALTSLYPHLVTKEKLLSATELQPFMNFSSQLAALDFIACTASDAFAMTDSGSQLSSLVSGYRIYYGEGKMTTIRPNKRRLADIFLKNSTIEWRVFEQRVRKAVRQTKHVFERPKARSIYRYPRCKECMCYSGF